MFKTPLIGFPYAFFSFRRSLISASSSSCVGVGGSAGGDFCYFFFSFAVAVFITLTMAKMETAMIRKFTID